MINRFLLLFLILSLSVNSYGESIHSLKVKINSIVGNKKATVGISILGGNAQYSLSINGNVHLPMQSVFKYHLAVAVLNQVDKGKLSLSDNFIITPKDLDNGLWSPIRKKYPEGAILTLAELLNYTVASSDNVGCDVLFKILGGPKVVENFFHQSGVTDIGIEYDEITQQSVWERQYKNWTTANAANSALRVFYENSGQLLSAESYRFLWDTMKSSWTGKKTIKGGLPKEAVVAHKTGYSGENDEGLIGAQNDIGIIFLPDGRYFYLSVLISDSLETNKVNKKIISDIAGLVWSYFSKKTITKTER